MLRNPCVLIVDDRAGNRELLASALRAEAYETREAQTIDHAVKLITSAAIDVVLTDVCIDRNDDGLTLLRQIKAARPLLPVVLYTAYGVVPDAVLAMKLGATDYLECPLETDLVVSTIRHALGITPIAASPTPFIDTEARLSASARWARYVLKAVNASEDPKTLRDWARCAATSYTSLREACYLLGIQPEDARDFVRALRVVVGLSKGRRMKELLDAPDRRALRVFWRRTGLPEDTGENITTAGFLRDQSLIPRANAGMKALEQGLRDGGLIAHPKV